MTQGWETELKRLDLTYTSDNECHHCSQVIRIFPGSNGKEKAEKEHYIMRHLNKVGYPVSKVRLIETTGNVVGKPFITMEYIPGARLTESITTKEEEEKAVRVMMWLLVRLHDIDPREVYPDAMLPTTQEAVERYLGYHNAFLEETGNKMLTSVAKWLRERRSGIPETEPSMLHGDYHADNILVRDNGEPVVIDWGASKIGDPREDLSWTMLLHSIYGDIQAGSRLIESYRALSSRPVEDIDYFLVMSVIRRLVDMLYSLFAGSEAKGMRKETVKLMKANKEQYMKAYSILKDITGLKLEELHSYLSKM